jgi:hypothetical protein
MRRNSLANLERRRMTQKLTLPCHDPQQAYQALKTLFWPHLKGCLLNGKRMVIKCEPETRSLLQNRRLWAMLTDISNQVDWYGRKLTQEEWKHVFTASLSKQDVVPGIDGGFVVLGKSTSKMTKAEMTELQELMAAFGAEKGVKFTATEDEA